MVYQLFLLQPIDESYGVFEMRKLACPLFIFLNSFTNMFLSCVRVWHSPPGRLQIVSLEEDTTIWSKMMIAISTIMK